MDASRDTTERFLPRFDAAGLVAEHQAVRQHCGLFDISHMGQFFVSGPGCAACHRAACRQRGAPPAGAHLAFDERQRVLTPFRFTDE